MDLDLFLKSEFESVLDFVFDSVIVYRFGKVCLNHQLYNYLHYIISFLADD